MGKICWCFFKYIIVIYTRRYAPLFRSTYSYCRGLCMEIYGGHEELNITFYKCQYSPLTVRSQKRNIYVVETIFKTSWLKGVQGGSVSVIVFPWQSRLSKKLKIHCWNRHLKTGDVKGTLRGFKDALTLMFSKSYHS